MLHIILVILKIVGILLAAILFLILAALLLVLFVPIRYSGSVSWQEKEKSGNGRITWLFHLISLKLSYEFGSRPSITLKILGKTLFPKASSGTASVKKPSASRKQASQKTKKKPAAKPTKSEKLAARAVPAKSTPPAGTTIPAKSDSTVKSTQTVKKAEPAVTEKPAEAPPNPPGLFHKIRGLFGKLQKGFQKIRDRI